MKIMFRASEFCVLHEDAFYEYYKPYRHPKASYDIWGGHGLETFGNDLEIVRRHDRDPALPQHLRSGETAKRRPAPLVQPRPYDRRGG